MTSVFIPADKIARAPKVLAINDSKSRQRRLHNGIVFFIFSLSLSTKGDEEKRTFPWARHEDGGVSLYWNSFVCCYQCCGHPRKSSHLLCCVQKPQAAHDSQHVPDSSGSKWYSDVYYLYTFYSCKSFPRQVDLWWHSLSLASIWYLYIWDE